MKLEWLYFVEYTEKVRTWYGESGVDSLIGWKIIYHLP